MRCRILSDGLSDAAEWSGMEEGGGERRRKKMSLKVSNGEEEGIPRSSAIILPLARTSSKKILYE
jgi:hypothetical protein